MLKTAFCERAAYWRTPYLTKTVFRAMTTNEVSSHRSYRKLLVAMNLTALLLTVAFINVSAAVKSQHVTFSGKNVPLEKLMSVVKEQTGYLFLYQKRDLANAKSVTITANNYPLLEFLDEVFQHQPLRYWIESKTINISRLPAGQLSTSFIAHPITIPPVIGKVVGPDGQPLAGVNIIVKGTKRGTVTNADGTFSIQADKGETLLVSGIGLIDKSINIDSNTDLGIIALSLSESKLDEVQIIAYGERSRKLNTGNVVSIKSDEIKTQPINNPLYALQGRVPGLIVTPTSGLPGSGVTIQIRGRNSLLSENTNPLIVIDGLPYQNNLPTLTPGLGALGINISALSLVNANDIESINILKDADATAIYGSRGANGVVLITTKKGKAGKAVFDLNVQQGISQVPSKMGLMNTQQYVSMKKEALQNDGRISRLDDPGFAGIYPDLMLWDTTKYTDWQKVLIGNNALFSDVQASLSGGTQNINYLIGGLYHRESTVFPGNAYDQKAGMHFSLGGNSLDGKLKSILTARYLSNKSVLPPIDFTSQIILEPNAPDPYTSNGDVNWALYPETGLATTWLQTPYSALLLQSYETNMDNLTATFHVGLTLGKFVARINAGFNQINGNSYKGLPGVASDPSTFQALGTDSRKADFSTSNSKGWSIEPQLTFSTYLWKGKLETMAGASLQRNTTGTSTLYLMGFINDELLKSQSAASTVLSKGNTFVEYNYAALFGRINYNVRNKYLLNLNVRRDGSSRFGPGNQFGTFASAGAAWIFTEEQLIKNNILTFGKIRASYGSSGNDGIGDYQYLERYENLNFAPYQGVVGFASTGLFNPNYHWETTRKMEVGLELGFFNNRILLTGSYYQNRSNNQLINYPYPDMIGYGTLLTNQPALIQNAGAEFALISENIKRNKFAWTSNFNISLNRNKLLRYPDLNNSAFAQSIEGLPFFDFVNVYDFGGVNPQTGLYYFIDRDGNKQQNPETTEFPLYGKDVRINTFPAFYGGWGNSFSYDNFSLELFFQFSKRRGLNPVFQNGAFPGFSRYNQLSDIYGKEWKKTDDVAELQKYSTTFAFGVFDAYSFAKQSTAAYIDASFIRLKTASLSYDFNNNLLKRVGLNSLRVFLQGQNLFTITNYKGLDPETQSFTALPPLRTVVAGIQVRL